MNYLTVRDEIDARLHNILPDPVKIIARVRAIQDNSSDSGEYTDEQTYELACMTSALTDAYQRLEVVLDRHREEEEAKVAIEHICDRHRLQLEDIHILCFYSRTRPGVYPTYTITLDPTSRRRFISGSGITLNEAHCAFNKDFTAAIKAGEAT